MQKMKFLSVIFIDVKIELRNFGTLLRTIVFWFFYILLLRLN